MHLSRFPIGNPTPTPVDLNTCLAGTFPEARHNFSDFPGSPRARAGIRADTAEHDEHVIEMNEVRERASDWVQRAAIRFKGMIDGPGHPTGHLAISGGTRPC
jgi:hypothetical protein